MTSSGTVPMRLIDIAIRESGKQATMTFEELVKGCTRDEREQLAWHLAMMRARRTFELLAKVPSTPRCRPEAEGGCTEPFHIDDGVPYCDTCGIFRQSKVSK